MLCAKAVRLQVVLSVGTRGSVPATPRTSASSAGRRPVRTFPVDPSAWTKCQCHATRESYATEILDSEAAQLLHSCLGVSSRLRRV
jgi:hypothetical protein